MSERDYYIPGREVEIRKKNGKEMKLGFLAPLWMQRRRNRNRQKLEKKDFRTDDKKDQKSHPYFLFG